MIVAIFMAGAHYTGLITPFINRRFFARVNQQRFHKDSCARENISDSWSFYCFPGYIPIWQVCWYLWNRFSYWWLECKQHWCRLQCGCCPCPGSICSVCGRWWSKASNNDITDVFIFRWWCVSCFWTLGISRNSSNRHRNGHSTLDRGISGHISNCGILSSYSWIVSWFIWSRRRNFSSNITR